MQTLKKIIKNTRLEYPAKRLYRYLKKQKVYPKPMFKVTPQHHPLPSSSLKGELYFSPKFSDQKGLNAFIQKKGYRSVGILGDAWTAKSMKIDGVKTHRVSNLSVSNPLEEIKKSDAVVLLAGKSTGLEYLKVLIYLYGYQGDVLIPGTEEGFYPSLTFESPEPIITCVFPCAGMMRFFPCMVEILRRLGRDNHHYSPLVRNFKHISRGKTESGYAPPDAEIENQCFYYHFKSHDYFQCTSIHEWIDLRRFMDLDCNIVVLMRDPRDIINSYFWHLRGDDVNYTQADEKELILRLIKGDTRFFWTDEPYAINWPNAKNLVDTYLAAQEASNMHVIRFEDLHSDEVSAYRNLLKSLKLYPHPFADFSDETLKKIAYLGSFEHQTGGRRKRGEDNKSRLANTGSSCRKGVVGDWRSSFTLEAVELFKELAGDGLVKLGYEKDNNWGL